MAEARPVALVTGGSSGIGAAFAREFARNGHDVVLVARGEARLKSVAAEIEGEFGVSAHVLQADLSDPVAPERIFAELAERGLKIGALVNNAGYGVPGPLDQSDWAKHRDCLEVMVAAPVHLAYLAAREMAGRGKSGRGGMIINIGSVSGFLPPHAGGTLYYPVKAFLIKFSLAHAEEVRASGVTVTVVCPGFTHTGFQEAAGGTVEAVSMPKFLWMQPEEVARKGYRAAARGDLVCVPGFINKLFVWFFKYVPDGIGRWIVRATGG
jgi:short-subunit dehydrogenase